MSAQSQLTMTFLIEGPGPIATDATDLSSQTVATSNLDEAASMISDI